MSAHETRGSMPHFVYRCYDADDRLVYIGCTSTSIEERLERHRSTHPEVAEQTVRWTTESHIDRESGLDAEANAIYRERPPLNTYYNPDRCKYAGTSRVVPTADELAYAAKVMDRILTRGDAA